MQWLRRTNDGIQRTRRVGLFVLVAVVGLAWLGFGVDATLVTAPGFLDVWGGPIALLTFGVLAFLALAYRLRRLLRRGG